jgi:hypothetical protein
MPRPLIAPHGLAAVLAEDSLSYSAKGVLAYLLTRPPGATVTKADLFCSSRDSLATIEAAVKELAAAGLLGTVRPRARGDRATGGVQLQPSR